MSLFFRRNNLSLSNDDEQDDSIDPELRLRTVRTAASAIAESIHAERRVSRNKTVRQRRSRFFRKGDKKTPSSVSLLSSTASTANKLSPGQGRNVHVNHPLLPMEVDSHGEPLARYVRNKVRTSKYTILTFVPKNLYEQFRRVANLYFLGLVILQLFPVFGAASGVIGLLPLAFIVTATAIKDGIEDYRRAALDEEVNSSAATKLGSWRNVNQPSDPRGWYEKLLGLNKPGKVTRGVRKLREHEAAEGARVMLKKEGSEGDSTSVNESSLSLSGYVPMGADRRLEDIQSMDSHSYPPGMASDANLTFTSASLPNSKPVDDRPPPSIRSQSTSGVLDLNRRVNGTARWERTLWKKLEVGDVVLLRENEQVPADIVVLSTSDADGMCYLETKNLDGETNLKPRHAARCTSSICSEEDVERSSFYLDSEAPHANLYLYHGVLKYKDSTTGDLRQEVLSINELLLRGCAIRNTSWAIGLVVYTGADTKIMLNGGDTPSKRSKIEKETNFNVIVNFVVLFTMCLISAIFSGLQLNRTTTSAAFFESGSEPTKSSIINAIVTFASCLIAFQNIVPISLYISIEIVKTVQAYFIAQDIDMYSTIYDTPCVPKTWNISDDLGQIEYIFSDKTGTLTQNIMEFQKCSVSGVAYGEGVTEAQRGAAMRQGKGADILTPEELNEKLASLKRQMTDKMQQTFKNRYLQAEKLTLVSPKLADDLANRDSDQRGHLIAFFRALALCHSVLADRPDPVIAPFRLTYKAESPDEAALVATARDVGFPLVHKTKDWMDIEVMGQVERHAILRVLEFNSTRKRMSVIVRDPEGRIVLYCKGADSVIYERLARDHDAELKAATQRDMEAFANSGLRTLCVAYRFVTQGEYLKWSSVYDAATSAADDREEAIEKANDLIEHSLLILGATALEDKLQEGVPEAIEMLHQAGIKLWILTGDKLQTAIEIGYSCNLLKSNMEVMILSADGFDSTRAQIEAGLNKIASVIGPPAWDPNTSAPLLSPKTSFAAVIDGDTLRHALSPELKTLFLNLGTQCETVVCCRVSPAQKALTVKLVKEGRNAMTLSIGDGANDVAMIQEANIGCGLFGLEGSQAAMSADYAFGQFRFLTKLLLVHGRWSYQRLAEMHSNFFYKNVIWTLAPFWFLPFNSFDATYLYEYTFILLYNLAFTSLPVMILGAFDQDLNAKAALAFPRLYERGIRGLEYTRTKFWLYMLDGLYQSAVVFFVPYLVWTSGLPLSSTARTMDSLADFGTTVAVAAIFSANTFVGINTQYWTTLTWIVVFGSSLVMLTWVTIYSFLPSAYFRDEVVILFSAVTFWTTVFLSVFIALAPRFLAKFFMSAYYPLDKEIIREAWINGDLKDRLGIRHRNPKKNKLATDIVEYVPMLNVPQSQSGLNLAHPLYAPHTAGSSVDEQSLYRDNPPASGGLGRISPAASDSGELSPPSDPRLPSRATPDRRMSPSPNPSYYSASEIPEPSPLPPPTFRYTTGEITTIAPNPRQSTSSNRTGNSIGVPVTFTLPSRTPIDVNAPQQSNSYLPEEVAHPLDSGSHKMQVRRLSPPPPGSLDHVPGRSPRSTSYQLHNTPSPHSGSFLTAQDDPRSGDRFGERFSDNDGTATISPDYQDRRESNQSGQSWAGGFAL